MGFIVLKHWLWASGPFLQALTMSLGMKESLHLGKIASRKKKKSCFQISNDSLKYFCFLRKKFPHMHSNHLAFCRLKPWEDSGIWLPTWKSFSCQTNPFPGTFLCEFVSVVPDGRLWGVWAWFALPRLGELLHTATFKSFWVHFNSVPVNSVTVSSNSRVLLPEGNLSLLCHGGWAS